jgi:hypothetical protein
VHSFRFAITQAKADVPALLRILVALLAWAGTAVAQDDRYTIDIVERSVRSFADSVCAVAGSPSGTFHVVDHPDAAWVESILAGRAPQSDCLVRRASEQPTADVVITINDISTRYELAESADSVRRRVVVSLSARSQRTGAAIASTSMQGPLETLTRERAAALESRQHAGTHAPMPHHPTTFWEDILQPAVFIAAAATTIVLLFTVRSQ